MVARALPGALDKWEYPMVGNAVLGSIVLPDFQGDVQQCNHLGNA